MGGASRIVFGKVLICLAGIMFFFPSIAPAQEVRIINGVGEALLGDNTTRAQAKRIALLNAKRNALEEAGVIVRGFTGIYNGRLINDLILSVTIGLITRTEILKDEGVVINGNFYWQTEIRAHVQMLPEVQSNFRIRRAFVQRPDMNDATTVFQNNDEIQVHVKANRESYMNIFGVDQNGNVSKLYPNEYHPIVLVPAGNEFILPDDAMREQGLKLRVKTPQGLDSAVETVVVIATIDMEDFTFDTENPTLDDLNGEIANIHPTRWALSTVEYEVRK